jgi:hypothetical protein
MDLRWLKSTSILKDACNGRFNGSWDAAPHVIIKLHRAQFRLPCA